MSVMVNAALSGIKSNGRKKAHIFRPSGRYGIDG